MYNGSVGSEYGALENVLFWLAVVLCALVVIQVVCLVVLILKTYKKQKLETAEKASGSKKNVKMRSLSAALMVALVAGTGFPTMLLLACIVLALECVGFAYFNIRLAKELKKPVEKAPKPVVVAKPEPKPEPVVVPEPQPVGPSEEEEQIVASLVRETITIEEAQEAISDSVASHFVEVKRTEEEKKYLKKCIINIDVLSEHFETGDTVDLQALRDKGLLPPKADYVKILARGVLNKPLKVVAQDFSVDAVKMIILTGGRAVKKL